MVYQLALFLHVVGALGYFIVFGLEWSTLLNLQRASRAEEVRQWGGMMGMVRWLGPVSMILILLAGIYMAATAWSGAAWIVAAFVTMVLIAPLGVLSSVRLAAIGRASATVNGPLSQSLNEQLHHPLLRTYLQLRTAMAVGIIFLMTVKPDMLGAVVSIGVAIVAGLVSSLPVWSNRRERVLTGNR